MKLARQYLSVQQSEVRYLIIGHRQTRPPSHYSYHPIPWFTFVSFRNVRTGGQPFLRNRFFGLSGPTTRLQEFILIGSE